MFGFEFEFEQGGDEVYDLIPRCARLAETFLAGVHFTPTVLCCRVPSWKGGNLKVQLLEEDGEGKTAAPCCEGSPLGDGDGMFANNFAGRMAAEQAYGTDDDADAASLRRAAAFGTSAGAVSAGLGPEGSVQLAKSCQATTYCPADEVSARYSRANPCSFCSGLWFCLFSGFASSNSRSLSSGFFKILSPSDPDCVMVRSFSTRAAQRSPSSRCPSKSWRGKCPSQPTCKPQDSF
eukprot:COSAG04_NODE_56_length_30604_cov_692.571119_28_plen_235_part_00